VDGLLRRSPGLGHHAHRGHFFMRLEDLIRTTILDNLQFHVDIFVNRMELNCETVVEARIKYKDLNYYTRFTLSDFEMADNKNIPYIKAKALRSHLERKYAQIVSDTFEFDVEKDLEMVIRDVVTELRK
jgi:hypothetical protein